MLMPSVSGLPIYQSSYDGNYLQSEYAYYQCVEYHLPIIQKVPPEVCKKHIFWAGVQINGKALGMFKSSLN